jgi:hypothetical protein
MRKQEIKEKRIGFVTWARGAKSRDRRHLADPTRPPKIFTKIWKTCAHSYFLEKNFLIHSRQINRCYNKHLFICRQINRCYNKHLFICREWIKFFWRVWVSACFPYFPVYIFRFHRSKQEMKNLPFMHYHTLLAIFFNIHY